MLSSFCFVLSITSQIIQHQAWYDLKCLHYDYPVQHDRNSQFYRSNHGNIIQKHLVRQHIFFQLGHIFFFL